MPDRICSWFDRVETLEEAEDLSRKYHASENKNPEALIRLACFHKDFDTNEYTTSLDKDILNFALSDKNPVDSDFIKSHHIDAITIHQIRERLNYNDLAYQEFEFIAKAGILEAQEELAFMYRIGYGWGIPPNRKKSIHWYNIAIKNGSTSAKADLKYMKEHPEEGL